MTLTVDVDYCGGGLLIEGNAEELTDLAEEIALAVEHGAIRDYLVQDEGVALVTIRRSP